MDGLGHCPIASAIAAGSRCSPLRSDKQQADGDELHEVAVRGAAEVFFEFGGSHHAGDEECGECSEQVPQEKLLRDLQALADVRNECCQDEPPLNAPGTPFPKHAAEQVRDGPSERGETFNEQTEGHSAEVTHFGRIGQCASMQ